MAGLTVSVKRAWSHYTQSVGAAADAFRTFFETLNNLVTDVESIRAYLRAREDAVTNVEFVATAGAGLDVDDGDDSNLETNRTVVCSYRGHQFSAIADDAIDVSAGLAATSTIGVDQFGVIYVYGNRTASVGVRVPATVQSELTDIAALAQNMPAVATEGDVPIACLMIEADSSIFEWGNASDGEIGPDSDTETYYDFLNAPYVTSAMASFALDAAAATFTYGAATAVLGDGTALTITGKANVAFVTGEQTVIATGLVGAFILYVLANDDEIAVQVSSADATLIAAQLAVDDLRPSPLLVELGRIYVQNDSGEDFTPGTTNLDATGITVTFESTTPVAELLGATDVVAATMTTPESQD